MTNEGLKHTNYMCEEGILTATDPPSSSDFPYSRTAQNCAIRCSANVRSFALSHFHFGQSQTKGKPQKNASDHLCPASL